MAICATYFFSLLVMFEIIKLIGYGSSILMMIVLITFIVIIVYTSIARRPNCSEFLSNLSLIKLFMINFPGIIGFIIGCAILIGNCNIANTMLSDIYNISSNVDWPNQIRDSTHLAFDIGNSNIFLGNSCSSLFTSQKVSGKCFTNDNSQTYNGYSTEYFELSGLYLENDFNNSLIKGLNLCYCHYTCVTDSQQCLKDCAEVRSEPINIMLQLGNYCVDSEWGDANYSGLQRFPSKQTPTILEQRNQFFKANISKIINAYQNAYFSESDIDLSSLRMYETWNEYPFVLNKSVQTNQIALAVFASFWATIFCCCLSACQLIVVNKCILI